MPAVPATVVTSPEGEIFRTVWLLESAPADRPLFLWVHLMDPHSPYLPPPPFERIFYGGEVTWSEIPLNMSGFEAFLAGVLRVLAAPEPPPPNPECGFCAYRDEARRHGM